MVMTAAENEAIYVDKLTNTDVSSLEVDSKMVDDDFSEPTSAETKAILWKLNKRIVPLMCLLYLCTSLGRYDIAVVRDTFQSDIEENGTFHMDSNGDAHKDINNVSSGNSNFFT
ncbi:hypothetical protein INT43_007591 [Umbelopsis isabellina]|uniref:Uncharacterized protein n=1 Tax=Mortierella isabellina TaxID=91625 RepID=A0A8H7PMR6_MORIS|nr:hypothetical protein INT43_007591 [Umbelopsis isabellina]